jgi:hypothetical protein
MTKKKPSNVTYYELYPKKGELLSYCNLHINLFGQEHQDFSPQRPFETIIASQS